MEWRPKAWIAIVLAIFFQPLAMLYLMRVGWAIVYFLASLIVVLTEMYLVSEVNITWLRYFSFNYVLIVICIFHAYRIARSTGIVSIRPWYSRWYGLASILLLPYMGIFITRVFLFEPFTMPSGSMLPTYPVGSYIFVSKWGFGNYRLFNMQVIKTQMDRKINRGDVIVFEYPPDPKIDYVKRVVGLPGDRVEYINKKLIINGVAVKYSEVESKDNYMVLRETLDGSQNFIQISSQYNYMANATYTVPAGNYFVLGDNRDNSKDSRYWGFVPQGNIIGKVIYILK